MLFQYLFPIHIPFNDPLSNAFEKNAPFISPITFLPYSKH